MASPDRTVTFRPRGVSDAVDGSNAFDGAMSSLSNLVPDPSTSFMWIPRPASVELTAFAGFTTPGFISALLVVGNLAYGMISTGRNAGKDEPFVYNLATSAFVTVSGVTNANTPTSPPSTGDWTPPIMALVGTKVVVTHPGFPGGTTKFGWFDVSNPAAPAWSAGDCSTNALPSTPVGVCQFNGRAYFACGNGVVFSDSLNATVRTNANQALTFGNGLPVTAVAGLPLASPLTGGVIQAVIAFQGVSALQQITGDPATSNLAVNVLQAATGTLSPLSIIPWNQGLVFISPDGLRNIDFNAVVSDAIGASGEGVAMPFIYASHPSRICGAANADVLRFSVLNGNVSGAPAQSYWYHIKRQAWSGPHTFPMTLLQPWSNTFVGAPAAVTAALFQSDVVPSANAVYTENGVALTWAYTPVMLPDSNEGTTFFLKETALTLALPNGQVVSVSCQDDTGATIDSVSFGSSAQSTTWGGFTWGAAPWGAGVSQPYQRRVPWQNTNVAKQFTTPVAGFSASGLRIGNLYLEFDEIDTFLER